MNQFCIIGRLTKDPEVKYITPERAVTNFSIAYNHSEDSASFFEVTVWDKQAEVAGEYLRKGHRVGLTGYLRQERYKNADGQDRQTVKLVATRIDLIEKKEGEPSSVRTRDADFGDTPPSSTPPVRRTAQSSRPAFPSVFP